MKTAQTKRLLDYLIANRSIDPLTSWTSLGIYRLAAVIFLLRKDGHQILTKRKEVLNTFNEKCTVAEYILL
jgi:hypothetical protein